jgi:hypothetical protein
VLFSSLAGWAAETNRSPIDIPEFSAVVASPDIKEPLTYKKLTLCMNEAARIMKVEDQARPQIVILQLSPAVAKRVGLSSTVLLSNKGHAPANNLFYEVWLVGAFPNGDLARGVEMVYELHYGIKYSDNERGTVVSRIANMLNATVSVEALRSQKGETSESR